MRPYSGLAISVGLLVVGGAHAQGVAAGKAIFATRCAVCHQMGGVKSGPRAPSLKGVVGRKPGSLTDFHYSDALKAKGGRWTPAALDAFLASPQKAVPGTRMVIVVPLPNDRADLIAFLKATK